MKVRNGVSLLVLIFSNLIAITFSVLSCVWLGAHGVIGHEFMTIEEIISGENLPEPNYWVSLLALAGAAILIGGVHLLLDSQPEGKSLSPVSDNKESL